MHQILLKKHILINSDKSGIDRLDIDKLEKVPNKLSSLKSKANKLDVGILETTPFDLSKLSDVVKMMLLKTLNIMHWLKEVNNIKDA